MNVSSVFSPRCVLSVYTSLNPNRFSEINRFPLCLWHEQMSSSKQSGVGRTSYQEAVVPVGTCIIPSCPRDFGLLYRMK